MLANLISGSMAQLESPAFMASMSAQNNALGDSLLAMSETLAVEDDYPISFARSLDHLNDAFSAMCQGKLIADATGRDPHVGSSFVPVFERTGPAGIAAAKKALAAKAREPLDAKLKALVLNMVDGRAGIPIGRGKGEPIIHRGFEPQVLRALTASGAISEWSSASLSGTLAVNLATNLSTLTLMNGSMYPYGIVSLAAPFFFTASAMQFAIGVSEVMAHSGHELAPFVWGGLKLIPAIIMAILDARRFHGPLRRKLDLPFFFRSTVTAQIESNQRLYREYLSILSGNFGAQAQAASDAFAIL